jgi:hypothetical protein
MHLCTRANATCTPGGAGCICALPRTYNVTNAGSVIISDDCSAVPEAFKSWSATQRAAGYWQFANTGDGTCLTVNTADVIRKFNGCECRARLTASLVWPVRQLLANGKQLWGCLHCNSIIACLHC